MPKDSPVKTATLYRMVMTDHMCPFGLKSKDLLERQGYQVDDHHFTSRDEVDAFKAEHGVKTTPQTFIGSKRIGGFDDLSAFFGKVTKPKNTTTYKPVIALFSIAALMALAVTWLVLGTVFTGRTIEWFI
jgi:glutaredoxin